MRDCEATGLAGKLGCTDVEGKGADENTARADGLAKCAKKLLEQHGREVTCRDASQMRCEGR